MNDSEVISDELSALKNLLLNDDRDDFSKQLLSTKNDILDTINNKLNELSRLNNALDEKMQAMNSHFSRQIETVEKYNSQLGEQQQKRIDNLESAFKLLVEKSKKEQIEKFVLFKTKLKESIDTNSSELLRQMDDQNSLLTQRLNASEERFQTTHEQHLQTLNSTEELLSQKLSSLEANLNQTFKTSIENLSMKTYKDFKDENHLIREEISKTKELYTEQKNNTEQQLNELKTEINSNLESSTYDLEHKISESLNQQTQLIQKVSSRDFIEPLTSQFIIDLLNKKTNEDPSSLASIIGPILHQTLTKSSKGDRLNISKELAPLISSEICQINESLPKNHEHLIQLISDNLPKAIELQNISNTPNLPNSLAPLIGKGLQAQINDEKDKIVDALYPVIGSTISKYMAESMKELVHKINTKIEDTFSFKKYFLRLKDKALGRTHSDLFTEKSIDADPQSIYLIHKKTGVVILDAHKDGSENSQKHMVGGMFSAITSFINDWIEKEGENKAIDSIVYGDSKVIFESSGTLIIAVVVNFGDTHNLRSSLRNQLADLHLAEHQFIEGFSGDTSSVPKRIKDMFKPVFSP